MTGKMTGKTVLVTGANSGVGFCTAVGLAKLGAEVVMTCRDDARGRAALKAVRAETGNERISLLVSDFASLASVKRMAEEFRSKHEKLHVLVNNAGAINGKRQVTADGYELTLQANHLAPFLLTNLLLPVIKQSVPARIVNVSSMGHRMGHIDFDDLMAEKRYDAIKVYAHSKLANILFTRHLAKLLDGSGVVVNAVHPGVVRTGFARQGGAMSQWFYRIFGFLLATPERGARTSVYVAASPETENITGSYFSNCREETPSAEARDMETARRLWAVSARLVNLEPVSP